MHESIFLCVFDTSDLFLRVSISKSVFFFCFVLISLLFASGTVLFRFNCSLILNVFFKLNYYVYRLINRTFSYIRYLCSISVLASDSFSSWIWWSQSSISSFYVLISFPMLWSADEETKRRVCYSHRSTFPQKISRCWSSCFAFIGWKFNLVCYFYALMLAMVCNFHIGLAFLLSAH